jgi:DNA-binding transcriptional ArsR family regulator
MVNRWELDLIFTALGDPTRRDVLHRLKSGVLTISDLAAPYAMSLPAFLKHLRVLEAADLITRHKDGRTVHVRLNKKTLRAAAEWLESGS